MKIASVSRLTVEKLLSRGDIAFFALAPAWSEPDKWRVFIPSARKDINRTIQGMLALHESVVIEDIGVFKTQRDEGWLHEVIFYFTSVPEELS